MHMAKGFKAPGSVQIVGAENHSNKTTLIAALLSIDFFLRPH